MRYKVNLMHVAGLRFYTLRLMRLRTSFCGDILE